MRVSAAPFAGHAGDRLSGVHGEEQMHNRQKERMGGLGKWPG